VYVGHTQETATEAGLDVRSDVILFRTLGKAQVLGEIAGQLKLVSEVSTGRIVGVHIIGPQATDLLAEGVLAVQKGVTVKELSQTIHAHPTLSESMLEASFKALDYGLHS
jgi:dihydrolipoamide dehydrogenase